LAPPLPTDHLCWTAPGLCAETGEWERFDHPDQLASYLGIAKREFEHRQRVTIAFVRSDSEPEGDGHFRSTSLAFPGSPAPG